MLATETGENQPDQRRRRTEETAPDAAGTRDMVRFPRQHRRRRSLWPLYAAIGVLGLLLLLWWFATAHS